MQPSHRSRAGFSLIELVAAVAILVILAGVLIPAVGNQMSKSRTARVAADLDTVAKAFNAYFIDTGIWPSNGAFNPNANVSQELVQLPCLYNNVFNQVGWNGPYLNAGYKVDNATMYVAIVGSGAGGGLRDPWGNNYMLYYVSKASANGNGAIMLFSRGPNGVMNTSTANIRSGIASGDDLVGVVTRAL